LLIVFPCVPKLNSDQLCDFVSGNLAIHLLDSSEACFQDFKSKSSLFENLK
jgi:hypothetical protein